MHQLQFPRLSDDLPFHPQIPIMLNSAETSSSRKYDPTTPNTREKLDSKSGNTQQDLLDRITEQRKANLENPEEEPMSDSVARTKALRPRQCEKGQYLNFYQATCEWITETIRNSPPSGIGCNSLLETWLTDGPIGHEFSDENWTSEFALQLFYLLQP